MSEQEALRAALKDCRIRCGELNASNIKLREALPALWGQYDDEGRKLWVDPAEPLRARVAELEAELAFKHDQYVEWRALAERYERELRAFSR